MQIRRVAAAVGSCAVEVADQCAAFLAKEITLNAHGAEARAMAGRLAELRGACGRLKGVSCDGGAGQGDCHDARSLGELRIAGLGVDHGSGDCVCGEIHMKASGARKLADLRGGVD